MKPYHPHHTICIIHKMRMQAPVTLCRHYIFGRASRVPTQRATQILPRTGGVGGDPFPLGPMYSTLQQHVIILGAFTVALLLEIAYPENSQTEMRAI